MRMLFLLTFYFFQLNEKKKNERKLFLTISLTFVLFFFRWTVLEATNIYAWINLEKDFHARKNGLYHRIKIVEVFADCNRCSPMMVTSVIWPNSGGKYLSSKWFCLFGGFDLPHCNRLIHMKVSLDKFLIEENYENTITYVMSLHLQQSELRRNLLQTWKKATAWFAENLEMHFMTWMQYLFDKLQSREDKVAASCQGEDHRTPQAKDQKKKRKKWREKTRWWRWVPFFSPKVL